MKYLDLLRTFTISQETALYLILYLLYKYAYPFFAMNIDFGAINGDLVKYFLLAPIGLFIWISKEARNILVIKSERGELLRQWSGYHMFKHAILSCFLHCILIIILMSIIVLVNRIDLGSKIFMCGGLFIIELYLVYQVWYTPIKFEEIVNQVNTNTRA